VQPSVSCTATLNNLDTIADGSFDVVASFETIEHGADVDAYISAVDRVLRPGGTFVVSTPDRRLASTLYPIRRRPSNPFHMREYVRDELLKVLAPTFRVVECLGQGYINRVFVFWPVLIGLKGSCHALRGLGAHRLIDRIYYDETDREVEPERDHPGSIPSYWVVRSQKV
jgi:SAM-dependent methyltransferase